ncbi:MAG TPA: PEGA domain-containing protein, partial [Polyangiales bacterium]|nr:PEGA domain-containing protein [Polyangiales bacterium]
DPSMHPAEVIGELAAAEAETDSRRPASLRVTSDPTGCAAFVQGRNLGITPLELPRLGPGEYRIQAECVPGEYGRVHRVTLGQSRAIVHVDAHLDAAVQTGSGISLRYGTAAASARLAVQHAIEVGRVVGAQRIALIVPEPANQGWIRISTIEVENGKLVAQVVTRVADNGEVAHLAEAIASLRAGRSMDFGGGGPAPLALSPVLAAQAASSASSSALAPRASSAAPASDDSKDTGAGPGAAVWTIAAVGAATHVTGWVLYGRLLGLEADYRKVSDLSDTSEAERRRSRIDDFELVPPLVAGGGAVLGTAALPWLLPSSEARDVPGWALGVGGGGIALAAVGIVLMVRGTSCDSYDRLGRCDDGRTTSHLGTMLLGSALPLLSVPVIYFARSLGADAQPDLSFVVAHEGASLHWRGTL